MTTNGFIRLDRELVGGDKWRGLSANARAVVIDMARFHNGKNNGSIRYGCSDALQCLRCSKSTAVKVFAELRRSGLVEVTERGSFTHKGGSRKGMSTAWKINFLR